VKKLPLAVIAVLFAIATGGTSAPAAITPGGNKATSAKDALKAREAAREGAAKEAAAREAAARKAERERILQRTMHYDPFTYRPSMSQYEVHRMIALCMKQRHEHMRSPGKPPEDPGDHDHGHGNDDHDHGHHDDHDNGNHNGHDDDHGHDHDRGH
jgi:hypothetical protein